jgi:hypothetical protein
MRASAHDERGTIFVLVALAMPVLLLFAALTLDVGNWYVTKRQLQNRADKGAIAAAMAYGYRYPACVTDPSLEAEIVTAARTYAGDRAESPSYNGHVGDAATVTVNDDACADQGQSIESPGGGASTNVEVSESVTSVMGSIGSLADLYSRSRVSVLQMASATGLRPFAVAEPRLAECAWVDFDRGNGPTTRVALARDANSPNRFTGSTTLTMSGASDSAYIDADVIVGDCASDSQRITYPNVGFVLAWDSGRGSPRVERVTLIDGCDDNPSFVPRQFAQCLVGVNAQVCIQNPRGPQIQAIVDGTTLNLPWPGGGGGCRVVSGSGAGVSPGDGGGDGTVDVVVRVRNRNPPPPFGNNQYGDWVESDPHRISAGDDLQIGPIRDLRLSVTDHETPGTFGQDITLVLDPLAASSAQDSLPVVVRGRSLTGSRASSGPVSCPDTPLPDALRWGCDRSVQVTTGTSCVPASCVGGTSSTSLDTSAYNALWAPNGVCTPNNWDDYDDPGTIPRGDPRLIVVPVVEPGAAFSGTSGDPGHDHPVRQFAALYVTGWQGGSCAGPDNALPRATASATAAIWGHFVKFVVPPSSGSAATEPCVPEEGVRACIATIVR